MAFSTFYHAVEWIAPECYYTLCAELGDIEREETFEGKECIITLDVDSDM